MRISRELMWMEMAHVAARRSTCFRLNVGALVISDNRIPVAIGYNGQKPGEEHCQSVCEEGGCNTIHAEINALDRVKGLHRVGALHLYCTDSPCMDCALAILRSSVVRVFYRTPYRDRAPLSILYHRGVDVSRVTPSGQVIPYAPARFASRRGKDDPQAGPGVPPVPAAQDNG